MPIGFQNFQLILAAVMIAGLILLLMSLVRMTAQARLPRLSVVLLLVPVVGLVWLGVVANATTRLSPARKEP